MLGVFEKGKKTYYKMLLFSLNAMRQNKNNIAKEIPSFPDLFIT